MRPIATFAASLGDVLFCFPVGVAAMVKCTRQENHPSVAVEIMEPELNLV
jgi:hypothetical protein